MSTLGIYIIEDEPLYFNKMMMLVDGLGYDLVGHSDNSDTAYVQIPELKPDLLLVDINVNGTMDGVELVTKLQKTLSIPVIFVTSFEDKETFDRSKGVLPCAYVTKPFESGDLQRAIELAFVAKSNEQTNTLFPQDEKEENHFLADSIFVKNRQRIDKISIQDILYLEVENNYTTLHTEGGGKHVLRMNLEAVHDKINQKIFVRTHRKYSINLLKMSSIDLEEFVVHIGDYAIPVGRTYKDGLIHQLELLK